MGEFFFHYTSRYLAQEAMISGRLRPGRQGKVYLTQDTYERGADAAMRLGISGKPVEIVCLIPRDRLPDDPQPPDGRHADKVFGPDSEEIRPGCGREWYSQVEIDISGASWISLSSP